MSKEPLGKLTSVDLREYWEREDTGFTNWLAQEENITLLSETLNLELSVEAIEKAVGTFRADIICRNEQNGSRVVIENQLEAADHDHLGKLFTYAAGLDEVKTLIWVVKEIRPDHRAALDWLNRITHEEYYFFGVEIELWRIGDSPPAPKFNIVVQPNNWAKLVQEATSVMSGDLTEGQKLQIEYWTSLGEYIRAIRSTVRPPKPYHTNWIGYGGLGRGGAGILLVLNQNDAAVTLQIDRHRYPDWFRQLEMQAEEIEEELGFPLQWEDKGLKYAHARWKKQVDATDRSNWPDLHKWMIETLETMRAVLRPRVMDLDAPDSD